MVRSNLYYIFFFFKQKTAYEMRISDWSSDVCSSDLWEASEIKIPPKRGMGVLPPDAHPERFGFGYRLCSRVDAGVKPTCACKRACSGLSLLTWQYSRYENGVSPHHVAAQCC